MDLLTSAKTSAGIPDAGGGLVSVRRFCNERAVTVNFRNRLRRRANSSSGSGSGQTSNDDPGRRKSCNLSNDLSRSSFSKSSTSKTERIHPAFATDVISSEFDKITETKEEVLDDLSRKPRVESTYLDKEGQTKLISVQDYLEQCPDFTKTEGPPRWFCSVDAKEYPADAPLLLFVPGMDSTGLGLLLHQKKLARLFEVQCLHIPLNDRTPFVGLLEILEQRIREEYDSRPGPIYLLGESFGASMVLSVAARNPKLDLVLVIVNPATSFAKSQLQPLLPFLQIMPNEFFRVVTPYLLSFIMGDPVRMASASVDSNLPPWERIPQVANAMTALLPTLPVLADVIPREILYWKLKLLSDGARYTNSRIRGVQSDILLLASGKDQMLPTKDEAKRLKKLLPQLRIRYFPNSGHTLLLEDAVDVASLIKVSQLLRHKKNSKFNPVSDFRPPFPDEVSVARKGSASILRQIFSPVFLSLNEDGRVRSGLPELPVGRPILLVSNHTFIGFDLGVVVEEFLSKKGVLLRGLAHPVLYEDSDGLQEPGGYDTIRLFGTVPVTGKHLYELLARGEPALLYPGGVREALKRKGEKYKLFWSETPEFVRTAIRHGATIVPFASVGGDDIVEIVLDSDEVLRIPFIGDYVRDSSRRIPAARVTGTGEVMQEAFVTPVGYPKIPPRMYFMFSQPIPTEGMIGSIRDKVATEQLYTKVKGEVEAGLEYLVRERQNDPYKDFFPRALYEVINDRQAPTFDY